MLFAIDIDDFGEREKDQADQNGELLRFACYNIAQEVVVRMNGLVFRTREEIIVAILYGQTEDQLYENARIFSFKKK